MKLLRPKVYTDGSVVANSGGWAYVNGNRVKSGSIDTGDSYEAELMAIYSALNDAEGDVCIVSDHWGIVKTLRGMVDGDYSRPTKAEGIWKMIERISDKLAGVEWMRRCTTHEQRVADELAGKAARKHAER